MRSRRTTIAGIACGLVCALSVFAYTQSVNDQAEQARADMLASYGGEQVEVCVATRDLAAGEIVPSDAVAMRSWIADFLPGDGALSGGRGWQTAHIAGPGGRARLSAAFRRRSGCARRARGHGGAFGSCRGRAERGRVAFCRLAR